MAIFISSSFLLVFILMFAVLWVLFNGMKERRRFDSSQTDVLSKEQKTMLVIFFIFELGYLVRAVNDSFLYRKSQTQIKVQGPYIVYAVIATMISFILIDGCPFYTLLFYHYRNFQVQSSKPEPISNSFHSNQNESQESAQSVKVLLKFDKISSESSTSVEQSERSLEP